jgi:predicted glycosyltransferase
METKAAYADAQQDLMLVLGQRLAELGEVQFIQRYNLDGSFAAKQAFVDSLDLVAEADLVVSHGGTLAREAALQGIPTIAISDMAKTYVNKYLAKRGFPLFITSEDKVLDYAKKYVGKRFDVSEKLSLLENPVDVIQSVIDSFDK